MMFIVSVFWAEADSVRVFSDNNRFGGEAGLSYSAERELVYPTVPDQKNLRVSSRADSPIISNRRISSYVLLMYGGEFGSYRDFPEDVRFADNLHVLSEHEHHPGEEIIRYIHDRDGEKEFKSLL
ncbi:MAG: hypothetical protein IJS24_09035 [Eubacterium sp.]|nr:hypothetical protein [Eubacterium sp.]